ncbi:asparaginase [Streptomyces sp. MST-110588]|uniref:asparaginase n=1 Tax=Streptomyces sp. MST-110588 TaxID=2833628 RepID=UPI001F5E084A|nr:asparaginase [Streptomyces sp. MST-110588]UNO38560.1 asparaginase [Streptomyces sp. MST-110588]
MSVALFTLGGTIAMAGRAPDRRAGDGVARLTGAELTAAVPGLADAGAPLDVRDTHAVPSAHLTYRQVLDLVADASRAVAAGARGVVVTQGTDTLEETAFLVDLVWPHAEPFVLTGAMRNPTLAGPDGPANLLAAVRVAASPAARDLGALIVFNDEIHAARWARKTHSTSTATIASPNAGPLGHVVEGRVRLLTSPPRREPLPVPAEPSAARVALYTVTFDDDGLLLDGVAEHHDGLILAGFGVGHVPATLVPALGDLAARMPVVLTSRSGSGSVLRNTYGAAGSETDLQRRGLINGGLLDPYKAKVLLRTLLANGAGREDIAAAFARLG